MFKLIREFESQTMEEIRKPFQLLITVWCVVAPVVAGETLLQHRHGNIVALFVYQMSTKKQEQNGGYYQCG